MSARVRALLVGGRACGVTLSIVLLVAAPVWFALSQCEQSGAELVGKFASIFGSGSPQAQEEPPPAAQPPDEPEDRREQAGNGKGGADEPEVPPPEGKAGDDAEKPAEPTAGFADFRLGMTRADVRELFQQWRKDPQRVKRDSRYAEISVLRLSFADADKEWLVVELYAPARNEDPRGSPDVVLCRIAVHYDLKALTDDPLQTLRERYGAPAAEEDKESSEYGTPSRIPVRTQRLTWAWPERDVVLQCSLESRPTVPRFSIWINYDQGAQSKKALQALADLRDKRMAADAAKRASGGIAQATAPPPKNKNLK